MTRRLSGCSQIGEWLLASCVIGKPGELSLLSIDKAKVLDSLAISMIDTQGFDKLSPNNRWTISWERVDRANLLAIVRRE
jgi:hypothetical protein